MKNGIRLLSILLLLISMACSPEDIPTEDLIDTAQLITLRSYYSNQTLARHHSALPDSTFHGESTYYHRNGEPWTMVTYHRGVRHGRAITYYEDGSQESVFDYKHGLPEGPFRWYYPDQQLKCEGTYAHGKQEGPLRAYYPDGSLQAQFVYEDGKKSGHGLEYHTNGKLLRYAFYNSQGMPTLQLEYDTVGQYVDHAGTVIADLEHDETALHFADRLKIDISLAVPPGWAGKLNIIKTSPAGRYLEERELDDTMISWSYEQRLLPQADLKLVLQAQLTNPRYPDVVLEGYKSLTVRDGKEVIYE